MQTKSATALDSGKPDTTVLVLSKPTGLATLLFIIVLYYCFLLSNGTFQLFAPEMFGTVFANMVKHLLKGQFDIDPEAINSEFYSEAFVLDGKAYTYFGIFPALLRVAALPFIDIATVQLAKLSCLTATVAFVALQLRMMVITHTNLP